jgi:hypothetical protein
MFETYKPSGGFGIALLPFILLGVAITVAAAFVYQLLLNWIPLIYINFLLTLGVGALLSFIALSICHWGHCRNRMLGFVVGMLLATSFLGAKFWFQYQAAYPVVRGQLLNELQFNEEFKLSPQEAETAADEFMSENYSLLDHLGNRVQDGWQIGRRGGGGPVAGYFVYLVWLIEAGIVCFLATTGGLSQSGSPYSEKTSTWANEEEIVMNLPISDAEMITQIQQASTVEQLLEIPIPKTDESATFAVYKTNSIPGDELEDAYLTVELVEFSINKKGEQEKKETPLVTHAILNSEKRKELIENASLLAEALADYRQAVNEEEINEEAIGEAAEVDVNSAE